MNEIYQIEDLEQLEDYLLKQGKNIRKKLVADFLRYADYKNASDWNKAVRLCECLAIIGWGEHEPVQAVRGVFFNGNPETGFFNRFREQRFVDAIWSKRKNGFTMEAGRTFYHYSPELPEKPTVSDYPAVEDIQDLQLQTQRNWIPKNPILITRGIANCYESSLPVIESIGNDLQKQLDKDMRPELYGNKINRIIVNLSFSSEISNYIIADDTLNLKQKDFYPALLKMFSKKEITKNRYYLRNRFEYGPFKNGKTRIVIHFEKSLGEKGFADQKKTISNYLNEALTVVTNKLRKKKLVYDLDLMLADFQRIIKQWEGQQVLTLRDE